MDRSAVWWTESLPAWQDRFQHWRAHSNQPGSLASDSVNTLVLGAHQRLWIAAAGRLQWIDPGDDNIHDAAIGQQPNLLDVRTLHSLPDGSLIAGGRHGLWHVDALGKTMARIGPPDLDVYAVALGADGSLWVATIGGGLDHLRADGSGFDHLRHDPDDPGSLVT